MAMRNSAARCIPPGLEGGPASSKGENVAIDLPLGGMTKYDRAARPWRAELARRQAGRDRS